MSIRITIRIPWALLLAAFVAQGCANVVSESTRNEIITGTPIIKRGEVRHELIVSRRENDSLEVGRTVISEPVFFVSAVVREPVTITTPQLQRSSREVVPYSGLTELWEFPWSIGFGWAGVLSGACNFGCYVAGINPFMNSERSMITGFPSRNREIETVSEIAMRPRLEERNYSRRVGGARVALSFPGMRAIEVTSKAGAAVRVPLEQLMTRPLDSAPRFVEGVATFKHGDETVSVRAELEPDISDRLLRMSRATLELDEASASDVARTLLEVEKLGFATRAQAVKRSGMARHGTSVLGRAIADLHMIEARAAVGRGDHEKARALIQLARARVAHGPKNWDLLEADLHEEAGFQAIDERDYERARSELLRASRLDRSRQARLSSFIAIAIEAMDREADREQRVGLATSGSGGVPANTTPTADPQSSNVLEQCLAREAALQACRLMPGFGKSICKSGVRAKYASVSCP